MITMSRGSSIVDRKQPSNERRLQSSAPYTSKIIQAGALLGDTKTLFSHWDVDASVDENINRVQRDNVFGKASRSRVVDILAIFRQRFLTEVSVTKALVTLVRESSRLPLWIDCCISTLLVQTSYFAMPSLRFSFRCRHSVWWTSTCKISSGRWQGGWMKRRRPGIGPKPRSPAFPKDCSRLFGTSVCYRGQSTKRSLPPTCPSSRLP